MYYHSKILAISMIAGALCSGLSARQPDSLSWKTIEQVRHGNAWLSSENAAGLYVMPSMHLSVVEGYAGKENGDFVNYGGSDNSSRFGARAESFYRLNPRLSFYGLLHYYNFTGKNMAGSYLINPSDAPFNIVEYSDDNRGRKEMEHYHLVGAVSADVTEKIVLGAKFDYTVANYGKMKDLRHKNELMDLNASIGAILHLNRSVDVGANVIFRRRVEGVYLDMYGKTDKTYTSLIDYGAFWGKKEQFGENGYTSDSEEKPLTDTYYGAAVQAGWKISGKWHLFGELTGSVRDGYYGKKSPSTVVFSNHGGYGLSYKGSLALNNVKSNHVLQWSFAYKTVENKENIYRYDNEGGGLTNVNYYGELETSDKKHFQAVAEYIGYWGMEGGLPRWMVKGGIGYYGRDIKASVYPYYRTQQLHWYSANAVVERMIYGKTDAYTLHIGSAYQKGGGIPYDDKMYSSTETNGNTPRSMSLYLMQEHEYLTKARVRGEIGLKYARKITDNGLKAHISLLYGYTQAFDVTHLQGGNLHELQLTVGCTF